MCASRIADPLVLATDLGFARGSRCVFKDACLTVGSHALIHVSGSNGAGKSTFLQLTAGLLAPSSGRVFISGFNASSTEAFRVAAYLPDKSVLYPRLTVEEQIRYVTALNGPSSGGRLGFDILERLGGAQSFRSFPRELSHGSQRKVSIALALLRDSRVLLLDEPFVGLDSDAVDALVAILGERVDEGAAVLLASHLHTVVSQMPITMCVTIRDRRFDVGPGS